MAQHELSPDEATPLDALVAFVEQHYQDHPLPGRILVNLDPAPVREALEAIVDGKVVVVAARYENERAWIGMAENNAGLALLVREQEQVFDQVLHRVMGKLREDLA